jgi:hypothetical protein
MYPLLPALVKLLSTETRNAQAGVGPARQRRATSGRRNFSADPIIAMFSGRGAVGESQADPREPSLNVQNDVRSSPGLSRRGYPAKSNIKIRKKRFG